MLRLVLAFLSLVFCQTTALAFPETPHAATIALVVMSEGGATDTENFSRRYQAGAEAAQKMISAGRIRGYPIELILMTGSRTEIERNRQLRIDRGEHTSSYIVRSMIEASVLAEREADAPILSLAPFEKPKKGALTQENVYQMTPVMQTLFDYSSFPSVVESLKPESIRFLTNDKIQPLLNLTIFRGLAPSPLDTVKGQQKGIKGNELVFVWPSGNLEKLLKNSHWISNIFFPDIVSEQELKFLNSETKVYADKFFDPTSEVYRAFRETFPDTPETFSDRVEGVAFDAVLLLSKALQSGGKESKSLRRALCRMPAFEGASGRIDFKDARTVNKHRRAVLFEGTKFTRLALSSSADEESSAVCGCGEAGVDANSNGVTDCLEGTVFAPKEEKEAVCELIGACISWNGQRCLCYRDNAKCVSQECSCCKEELQSVSK